MTEEAGIYRLISPNNTSIAILYGDLKISSAGKDGETARYTFMTSDAREVDDVYTVYDQRGGVIPD